MQKEQKEGKKNFLLLYLKENPETNIEDSTAYVKAIVDEKKREFIEQALMDGFNELPKECRHLHLSCLKVFQMFFDSSNRYDSSTEFLQDIQKAIYLPLQVGPPKPSKLPVETPRPPLIPAPQRSGSPKRYQTVARYGYQVDHCIKKYSINCVSKPNIWPRTKGRSMAMLMPLNLRLCFM